MDTFYMVVESIYFKISIWLTVGVCIGVCVYNMIVYMRNYSGIGSKVKTAYMKMQENERDRLNKSTLEKALKGAGAERTLLDKFDEMINVSGIGDIKITHKSKNGKVTVSKITSEICLIASIVVLALIIILTMLATGNFITTITITVAVMFIAYMALKVAISQRNRNIEGQLVKFMNVLDNLFIYNSDVTAVLRDCAQYMDNPLRGIIIDSVLEAETSGDPIQAFNNLQGKVESKYFKQLIHNLSVCSRHANNYSDIIADTRSIFTIYSKTDKEKGTLKKTGALQTLLVLAVGVVCIGMLGGITGKANVIEALMTGGPAGNIILFYLVISVLASIYIGVIKVLFD